MAWELIAWVANDGDTPPAPTGYSDSDVTEGTTYRYAVTSNNVDSDGEYHESEWSEAVTATAEGEPSPEPEPEPVDAAGGADRFYGGFRREWHRPQLGRACRRHSRLQCISL